jgi:hypothetical protein
VPTINAQNRRWLCRRNQRMFFNQQKPVSALSPSVPSHRPFLPCDLTDIVLR